jgi:hypothetical protein
VADSTLIGVAIGGGIGLVSAAVAGVVAGRYQVRTASLQAGTDRERLVAEHARRDLEHRQGVYHDFLNTLSRLSAAATASTVESFRSLPYDADPAAHLRQLFLQQMTRARELLNGTLLFGTPAVARAAEPVERLFAKADAAVSLDAILSASDLFDAKGFQSMLDKWEETSSSEEWQKALGELKRTMRAEVAPAGEARDSHP